MKTFLFDLGGVFLHYDPMRIVHRLCREFGHLEKEETESLLFHSDFAKGYERGRLTTEAFYENVQNALRISIPFERFKNHWQNIFSPIAPMLDFLESIRGRFRLVAVSNTNPLHIQFLTERYAFFKCFDHTVYSYEVGAVKPEREIFQIALRRSRSDPHACLFVDDNLENIRAAEALGIRSFHLVDPVRTAAELTRVAASFE